MRILVLVATFIFCMCANTIWSQDDSLQMEEVIISANKVEEKARKVAQQVQVISTKSIILTQSQNPADLIQQQGVFVQKSQQGGGSPVLRGFEASRVLLVMDGVRMNNAIYRSGHLQNILTLDNNTLERIEVLFGPSSTIYGSDALGGVISFVTKKPKLKNEVNRFFNGTAMIRHSSVNNEKTAHINFNLAGSKLASFTSLTYSSFGDLLMGKRINPALDRPFGERLIYQAYINGKDSIITNDNRFLQVGSGYKQMDVIHKMIHTLDNGYTQGLNIQYSTSSDVPRYDRLTDRNVNTQLNQGDWYYGPQNRLMIAYELNSNGTQKDYGMHLGLHYQAIEESRFTRRFNSKQLASRIEQLDIISGNLDFRKHSGKSNFRYGVDFQLNKLKSDAYSKNITTNQNSALDTRYPDGENYFHNVGGYLSHSMEFEKLIINDGIRLGYSSLRSTFLSKEFFPFPFDEVKQNTPTYSANIGLNYLLGEQSKVSMNLASGFRTPNIDDLGKVFESTQSTLIVPNSELKPERTLNIDLGTQLAFGKDTKFQLVLFNTAIQDAIVTDDFTFDGKPTILYNGNVAKVVANQNKRKARIYGFTIGGNTKIANGLTFDVNATMTKGKINDAANTPLDHIPPFVLRSGLDYSKDKFTSSFFIHYNGWKRIKDYNPSGEDNQQYAPTEGMPSWYTLNLKTSYRLNDNIQFLVSLDNLLDLQYRVFASGINGAGRNLSISVKGML
jgi:hemoglobin/transferrin/lactoferrin receptor protein